MKIRNIEISDLEICSKILEKEYSKKPYFEEFEEKNSFRHMDIIMMLTMELIK